MTPETEHKIDLCECRGGTDYRGNHVVFYERDEDGWIRCRECGNVPPEIASAVPAEHRIELRIHHQPDSEISRIFRQIIPPPPACPECEAEGTPERGIKTDKVVEDGELLYRCAECGRAIAGGGSGHD